MTYLQYHDPVTTPEGPGTCLGLWPDRKLVMVRLATGRVRSFDRHQVELTEVTEALAKCEQAIAEAFGIEEAAE